MTQAIIEIGILSLACAAMSFTLSKSHVGEYLSQWFSKRGMVMLTLLFDCPYCLSHWIAFPLVFLYQPVVVSYWLPLDLLISAFAIVGLSGVISGVITYFIRGLYAMDELKERLNELS